VILKLISWNFGACTITLISLKVILQRSLKLESCICLLIVSYLHVLETVSQQQSPPTAVTDMWPLN